MVRIGLNMIVKNEAHIIREVMTCTLPLIDTYVIVDTGSTDNTIQVIKDFYKEHGIEGHVFERPWTNFGHNRSEAIKLCDGHMDYCIVIDADDLMHIPKNGKNILNSILEQEQPNNLNVKIHEGGVIYSRGQIFKANDNWRYIGVLHEYAGNGKPDNKTIELPENFFMTSRRLGGRNLTGDKQQKDIALLEQGVKDEPDNDRYMYYLGQSYLDAGRVDDAIVWYKKRFHIGRWIEESFHAAYKVGECYLRKQDIIRFEKWMQIAHKHHPARAEPIYQLASFFRKTAQFYKSYHYIQLGRKISYPKDDVLFVESFPHKGGFDFEASIVECYTHPDKNVGLRSSIVYLLKLADFRDLVITNLKYYVQPISNRLQPLNIPAIFGEDFRPSAVSVLQYPFANVRFVNYLPPTDGQYRTKDSSNIQTQNAYVNLETGECISKMDDLTVDMKKLTANVKGLEDIRLFSNKFIAVSYGEYSKNGDVQIVVGDYDGTNGNYNNCNVIPSPINNKCEKNWLPIPDTDMYIYKWSPFQIGKIENNKLIITIEHKVQPLFELFRGSTPPIAVNEKLWSMVHFVDHTTPRIYYHCFVEIDKTTYQPIQLSLPFKFKSSSSVEYCISCRSIDDRNIECYVSFMDSDPHRVIINIDTLQWIDIRTPSIVKDTSIIRVPSNASVYWAGLLSACYPNGSIEKYIDFVINKKRYKASAIFSQSDGFFSDYEMDIMSKTTKHSRIMVHNNLHYSTLISKIKVGTIPIVCALATRGFERDSILLLPLDDQTFTDGLDKVLSKYDYPSWTNRKPIVFWRGNTGGYEFPSKRTQVVELLLNHPNTDVKLALLGDLSETPPEYVAPRCDIGDHFHYKYILIMDGTCIASNHQWVFGSGSVPIMITHPDNNFWFQKYLKPMVNYVPVNYDLSNLKEQIDWLVRNDGDAENIAINAVNLSKVIFNSKFQQHYIESAIDRIIKNQSVINFRFEQVSLQPSDINEHIQTLYEYTKKCNSVVECGVRNIVSSYAFANGLRNNPNNSYTLVDPCACANIYQFLELCKTENINASFLNESDLKCKPIQTDLLFIDTWHVYAQLKRELAHWHQSVQKYIIMHDTTVDEWQGETVRTNGDAVSDSIQYGFPVEEINKGLWPAIDEFMKEHPEWVIQKRYTNNNGLTILARS
jgi:glycosyltransferase involved in cell wall biosynthesis